MNKQDITNLINSKIIDNDNGLITAEAMREVLHAIDEASVERYEASSGKITNVIEKITKVEKTSDTNAESIEELNDRTKELQGRIDKLSDIYFLTYEELYRLAYHKKLEPGKRYAINNAAGFFKDGYSLTQGNGNLCSLTRDYVIILEALTSSSFNSDALRYDNKGIYDAVRFVFDYPTMNQGVMQPWLSIGPTEVEENINIKAEEFVVPGGVGSRVYRVAGYDTDYYIYYTDDTGQTFRFVEKSDSEGFVQNDTAEYQYNDFLRIFAGWRGAVVWMRDEKGNEAPYDFKTYGVTNLSEGCRVVCAETNIGNFTEESSIRIVNGRNNIYKDMSLVLTYGEGNVIERSCGAGFFMNSRLTNSEIWARECISCDIRDLSVVPPVEDPSVLLFTENAVISGNKVCESTVPLEELFFSYDSIIGSWYYDTNFSIMRPHGALRKIYPLPIRGGRITLPRPLSGNIVRLSCLFNPGGEEGAGATEELKFLCQNRSTGEEVASMLFSSYNDYHLLNLEFIARDNAYTVFVEKHTGEEVVGDYQNVIFEQESLYY